MPEVTETTSFEDCRIEGGDDSEVTIGTINICDCQGVHSCPPGSIRGTNIRVKGSRIAMAGDTGNGRSILKQVNFKYDKAGGVLGFLSFNNMDARAAYIDDGLKRTERLKEKPNKNKQKNDETEEDASTGEENDENNVDEGVPI